MAEAPPTEPQADEPRAYKGKDGQVYQLFFKDEHEEPEEDDVRTLTTSSVDPYSDLNIRPPGLNIQPPRPGANPFRTTAAQPARERVTVRKKVPGSEDVVLFEKKPFTDEESDDDENELDTLLRGRNGDAVVVSMESIDMGGAGGGGGGGRGGARGPGHKLLRTDSDLDLLMDGGRGGGGGVVEALQARGRWFMASLHKCPPWQSYARVAALIAGVFLLYVILIVIILEVLGT